MTKQSYAEKLRDPRWQKKRLEILERDGWTCRCCGDEDKTLHIHHRYYLRGIEPWEYELESLITLCEHCHNSGVFDDIRKDMVRYCGCVPSSIEWSLRFVLMCFCSPSLTQEAKKTLLNRVEKVLRDIDGGMPEAEALNGELP